MKNGHSRAPARWEYSKAAQKQPEMEERNLIWEDFDSTQEGGKRRRISARLKSVPKADYLGLDENILPPSKPPPPPKKEILVHDAQDLEKQCVAVQRGRALDGLPRAEPLAKATPLDIAFGPMGVRAGSVNAVGHVARNGPNRFEWARLMNEDRVQPDGKLKKHEIQGEFYSVVGLQDSSIDLGDENSSRLNPDRHITPLYNGPMIVADECDPRRLLKNAELDKLFWWEGFYPYEITDAVPYISKVMSSDLCGPAIPVPHWAHERDGIFHDEEFVYMGAIIFDEYLKIK